MSGELTLLIGTYTQPEAHVPTACGEGIVTCSFDTATGTLTKRGVFKGILNPSYLAHDGDRSVFAVSEYITGEGAVWQFASDAGGVLTPLVHQKSHGAATCHVALLPGNRVCAASYIGGTLAVYPLTDGRLAAAERVFRYQGRGANPQRQEASHAHQVVVSPDRRWFYACDLGADRVWQHDIDVQGEPIGLPMPAGHGPRHLAFHPALPRAWVLGELTGSVAVCDWNSENGALEVIASTPAIEEDAAAAAIRVHPTGRSLWISLRKHPALRVYQIDAGGMPGPAVEVKLAAGQPRDFTISPDGRWLLAATQEADEIVVISLDPATGLPTGAAHRHFPVKTPVCLLFLTENGPS